MLSAAFICKMCAVKTARPSNFSLCSKMKPWARCLYRLAEVLVKGLRQNFCREMMQNPGYLCASSTIYHIMYSSCYQHPTRITSVFLHESIWEEYSHAAPWSFARPHAKCWDLNDLPALCSLREVQRATQARSRTWAQNTLRWKRSLNVIYSNSPAVSKDI